jgi:hypothetical protein
MSEEYLESVRSFFQERLKSQTKRNYDKCEGCNSHKQFIITKDKLVYTCGSKSGNCGKQLEIKVQQCVYFPDMKNDIYKENDQYDYNNKLDDLFTKQEIESYQTNNKQKKDLLKYNQKLFTQINQHKKRQESIKKLHKDRCKDKKELIILQDKIKNESNPDKKNTFMREYVQINQRMNSEYKEMLEFNQKVNNFIPIVKGEVSKLD